MVHKDTTVQQDMPSQSRVSSPQATMKVLEVSDSISENESSQDDVDLINVTATGSHDVPVQLVNEEDILAKYGLTMNLSR